MTGESRAGAVQIYAHTANAAFAEKIAAALDRDGRRIVNGPFNQLAVDAVIVVWSGAAMGSERLIAAAREPLACGVLAPVSIGLIEPPPDFAHLPAHDLQGWNGAADDPRWRAVLAALDRLAATPAPAGPGFPAEDVATPAPAGPGLSERLGARAGAVLSATRRALSPLPRRLGAMGKGARLLLSAMPRAALAGAVALAAAGLAAGFLFLAPNEEPPAPVAAAPAEPEAPPLLATVRSAAAIEEPAPAAIEPPAERQTDVPPAEEQPEAPAEIAAAPPAAASAAPAPESPSPKPAGADRIAALIAAHADDAVEVPARRADAPFRDCPACPEMAVIPAGRFLMGAPSGEIARQGAESPQVEVAIARPFALARREVSFAEWDACLADGGCGGHRPSDAGFGRGDRPVIHVSYRDALAYTAWLSAKTGRAYRLPSEAEWEYAARAGAEGPFSFGRALTPALANYDAAHPYGGAAGQGRGRTLRTGAFAPNAFGLYDMHGNVWEWTADCWRDSRAAVPRDGAALEGSCRSRVLKGGAWNSGGWRLRAAHRLPKSETAREFDNGFRVAAALD